jgi:hypothetical protein
MANRPCKPDGDLKKLWQMLMPGVAMPACGTGQETEQEIEQEAAPSQNENIQTSEPARDGTKRRQD